MDNADAASYHKAEGVVFCKVLLVAVAVTVAVASGDRDLGHHSGPILRPFTIQLGILNWEANH